MIIRQARSSDARGIAKVGVDTWRTTYRGIIPDEHLNNLSYERSEAGWANRISDRDTSIFVCESDSGDILGYAYSGPERNSVLGYSTEVYAIYVLDEHQGCGIGRQLLSAIVQQARDHGGDSLVIWVLSENPSRGFYERLGGVRLCSQMTEIGGVEIEETAYGWNSLASF